MTNQWTQAGQSKLCIIVPETAAPDETQQQKQTRIPWWLWPHVLSLEAPIVAALWQTMLARMHRIALLPATAAGLALVVWVIYVTDRLLDGAKASPDSTDARHAFYRRHFRLFTWLVVPLAVIAITWIALWLIPEGLMWQCGALGLLVVIYIGCFPARHHRRLVGTLGGLLGFAIVVTILLLPMPFGSKIQFAIVGLLLMTVSFFHRAEDRPRASLPKELLGSLLFALGCAAGVQFYVTGDGIAALSLDIFLLWLLFGMNMFGIACVEGERGARDPKSVSTIWPHLPRWYPVMLCGGIAMCILFASAKDLIPLHTAQLAGTVGVALFLLACVWLGRARLSPLAFRVLADLAVAAPTLKLLM